MISVAGVDLEVLERGQGVPILYLHGGAGIDLDLPLIERMAKVRRVIAPSHPGFGRSGAARLDRQRRRHRPHLSRTDGPDEPGARRSGRLLDRRLDRGRDRHQGAGTPASARADRSGRRQDRQSRQARHSRHLRDAAGASSTCCGSTIRARTRSTPARCRTKSCNIVARNAETLALLTWEPYMHNPKLRHRLHRVGVPTLFLRGASDGIVSAEYLAALRGARSQGEDRDHRGGRPSAACRAAGRVRREGAGVPQY